MDIEKVYHELSNSHLLIVVWSVIGISIQLIVGIVFTYTLLKKIKNGVKYYLTPKHRPIVQQILKKLNVSKLYDCEVGCKTTNGSTYTTIEIKGLKLSRNAADEVDTFNPSYYGYVHITFNNKPINILTKSERKQILKVVHKLHKQYLENQLEKELEKLTAELE